MLPTQHSVRRVRNREIVLPLVLGTVAHYLGKKATETNSHRWTVYLRALDNTDLSHIISKVPASPSLPALLPWSHDSSLARHASSRRPRIADSPPPCPHPQVTFQLHHSFENANREITSQPFEVTEHGWGEFAIGIKVSFTPDAQVGQRKD